MYYIGVDLGTSSVKLLLMDESGNIINSVTKSYDISFPKEGWSEQNPKDWYEKTVQGIRELVEADDDSADGCEEYSYSDIAKKVAGISFGGQMHGLVILDKEDNVIRPAILWNDGRTTKECEYLNKVIGKEKLAKYTANIAFAGFTAPKLLWLRENEPENFKKIAKIMLPKDYLCYKMTGIHSTDVSDASGTLLFDVRRRCWSEEMLKICGISENMLPHVYESYECVGKLTPLAAADMRLMERVKVSAGAGDNAAAAIGTGTIGNGMCNISLGTSGTIFISTKEFCVDENNALHSFDHADGGYHLMGCMLSAASCNKWWMEDIIKTSDYNLEQEKISEEMLGNNKVFYLPYMMGERSPHNNPLARGTFTGMTLATTRTDMTLAVLEGVAFAIRDSLEVVRSMGIEVNKATICGGGAKSGLWRKIIANVLKVDVCIPANEEGPALGAAMLAAVGNNEYENVKEAVSKIVKISGVCNYDEDTAERYEKKYKQFKSIYPAMKPVFDIFAQND